MSPLKLAAAAALACAIGGPALAQETGGYPPGTSVADIEAREQAETVRLNNAVLERDARVVAANEAEAARFAADQADYEAEMAAHDAATARYEAEAAAVAAAQARYEAEMAIWRERTNRRY